MLPCPRSGQLLSQCLSWVQVRWEECALTELGGCAGAGQVRFLGQFRRNTRNQQLSVAVIILRRLSYASPFLPVLAKGLAAVESAWTGKTPQEYRSPAPAPAPALAPAPATLPPPLLPLSLLPLPPLARLRSSLGGGGGGSAARGRALRPRGCEQPHSAMGSIPVDDALGGLLRVRRPDVADVAAPHSRDVLARG